MEDESHALLNLAHRAAARGRTADQLWRLTSQHRAHVRRAVCYNLQDQYCPGSRRSLQTMEAKQFYARSFNPPVTRSFACKWSEDNRLAVVTEKGVNVFVSVIVYILFFLVISLLIYV